MKCHVLSCDAASRPVPQSFNSGSDSAGKHPVSTPCRSLSVAPSTRTPPLTESLPRFPPGHPRIAVRPRSKSGCCRRQGGTAVAEDFDLPAIIFLRQRLRYIAASDGPRTCHEMSCSVMRCHVFPPPRPSPPASPKRRMSPSCMSSLHRVSLRSRRRRLACGASLFRAYRMRARARVCAGAVRAPDCAREPGAGRTSPVRSVGGFFAPVQRETKRPPDAASSCPILPQFYGGQALIGNYFIIHERIATSVPKTSSSPTPDPLSPGSPPHRRAVRVEERLCLQGGGTEVAEDFDFPAVLFRRQHLATSISRTSRPTELPTRRHLLRP